MYWNLWNFAARHPRRTSCNKLSLEGWNGRLGKRGQALLHIAELRLGDTELLTMRLLIP